MGLEGQMNGIAGGGGCPSTCLGEGLSPELRPVGPDWKAWGVCLREERDTLRQQLGERVCTWSIQYPLHWGPGFVPQGCRKLVTQTKQLKQ